MAGNYFRIITIIYSFTKRTSDFTLIGIFGKIILSYLFQYISNVTRISDKCIVSPITYIFESTISREKDNIENRQFRKLLFRTAPVVPLYVRHFA